jgi:hypothetical protein
MYKMDKNFKPYDGELIYENPFSTPTGQTKFKRVNPRVLESEFGIIIEVCPKQYDYLIDGDLITQRVGASEELLKCLNIHNVKAKEYTKMYELSKNNRL